MRGKESTGSRGASQVNKGEISLQNKVLLIGTLTHSAPHSYRHCAYHTSHTRFLSSLKADENNLTLERKYHITLVEKIRVLEQRLWKGGRLLQEAQLSPCPQDRGSGHFSLTLLPAGRLAILASPARHARGRDRGEQCCVPLTSSAGCRALMPPWGARGGHRSWRCTG